MSPRPPASLFLVFFLTSLHAASSDGCNINIIHETRKKCAKEDPNVSYKFCVASLESSPNSHCADFQGLGPIPIKLLRHNVTNTRSYTKKLLKKKKMNPFIKASLQDCLELYPDAVPTLKEVISAYRDKRHKDANVNLSMVMDALTTCKDGVAEKGAASPLTEKNKALFWLSALAPSILRYSRDCRIS